jgi:aminoglycoside phosphotransferase (APT) family kinase protein
LAAGTRLGGISWHRLKSNNDPDTPAMLNSDFELTQNLTAALTHLIPRVYGSGAELTFARPVRIDRRYSFMFRYWVKTQAGNIHPLLIKIPHADGVTSMAEAIASAQVRAEIRHEFEVMRSIYTVIQNSKRPQLFAINPVGGYLLDFNALVMEEVPLQMLKSFLPRFSIIMNIKPASTLFEAKLNLAGEWLRVIHNAFQSDRKARLGGSNVRDQFQNGIRNLEKLSNARLDKIHTAFMQLYEVIVDAEVPVSALHNDYHLGNIFVTPEGGVGALDPNWRESGIIFQDLASLLIDPLTRKMQVLFQGLLFRRTQKRRYEQAILQGYFGKTDHPYALVYFYCALTALEKWLANEELLRSRRSPWARILTLIGSPFIGSYFQRLVQDYLTLGLKSAKNAVIGIQQ